MGVTVLQQFPVQENWSGPQTIEFLTKRIMALGAVQTGQFLVDCESYTSVVQLGSQKTVHVLHNSEQPASVFSILESGGPGTGPGGGPAAVKNIPVVADSLFDLLMMKMTSVYTSKKQTKVESKGPRFELGDFCIKLGSVSISQNFKAVLVEVEYRPCVIPGNCWELIKEFLQGFLGSCVTPLPPPYLQARVNEVYTSVDTVQQYLEHFIMYRKSTPAMLYSK
uniref:Mediator of RNA polymerase II transcription subunit 20 n=4 Tax=Cacopsylla melanoneura TaxID=428564 RepID=A0A8D8VCM8_9HEMI